MESAQSVRAHLLELEAKRKGIEQQIEDCSSRLNAPGGAGLVAPLIDKEGFPRADVDVVQARKDRHTIACLSNDRKSLSNQLAQLLERYHALARQETGSAPPATTAATSTAPSLSPSAPSSLPSASSAAASLHTASPTPAPPAHGAAAAALASSPAARGASPPAAAGAGPGTSANAFAATAAATACGVDAAPAAGSGGPAAVLLLPFALVDEVVEGSPAAAAGVQIGDQLCIFGAARAGDPTVLQTVASELTAHEGHPVQATVLRHGQPLSLRLTPQRWAGRGLLGCHLRPL